MEKMKNFLMTTTLFVLSGATAMAQNSLSIYNSAPITIPVGGAASNYPSEINVGGLSGTITDVNIALFGISHARPDDIDVMLVAPDGTRLVVMSDVFGGDAASNVNLYFDDSAPGRIALSEPFSGAYKPTNNAPFGEADSFPAPAPAPNGTTELNAFNGHNPNGVWRLYVVDDNGATASGNISAGWRLEITAAPANRAAKVLDFDGDGRTDFVMARNNGGRLSWYIQQSRDGFRAIDFGINGDAFVPADYDGDGKTDIAVWGVRPGTGTSASYYVLRSSDDALQVFNWGVTNDDPRYAQDFDGDGRADPTVVRSDGFNYTWFTLFSTGGFRAARFGGASFGDLPLRGDYDGDGRADIAVFRSGTPSPNVFHVLQSSSGSMKSTMLGRSGTDFIIPADFDGDGLTDCAVWRGLQTGGDSGAWYWLNSRNGNPGAVSFGLGGAIFPPDWAVPGDYDGDGRSDQAVWRRNDRTLYVNGGTAVFSFPFGLSTDRIVPYELQIR